MKCKQPFVTAMTTCLALALIILGPSAMAHTRKSAPPKTITSSFTLKPAPILSGVSFATPTVGYLIANHGISKTMDGGRHFTTVFPGNYSLNAIKAWSSLDVVAYSTHHIVTTTDGGRHFRTYLLPKLKNSESNLINAYFVSPSVGYVVVGTLGESTALYKTINRGATWVNVPSPKGTLSIGFSDIKHGWLIASTQMGGYFYHTVDAGLHWILTKHIPTKIWSYAEGATIYPVDSTTAYMQVIGQGGMSQSSFTLFKTTNSRTWSPVLGTSTAGGGPAPGVKNGKVAQGPGYDAGPVSVVAKNTVYVLGGMEATGTGTVELAASHNGGTTFTTYTPISGANGTSFGSTMMSFANVKDGWLVDGNVSTSTLLHTTDGGITWRSVYPRASDFPIMGVSFVSTQRGFGIGIVGDRNLVLVTNNGGHTFTSLSHLPVKHDTTYLGAYFGQGISFINRNRGYAVGGDEQLYETQSGGHTWSLVKTPKGNVFSVYFVHGTLDGKITTSTRNYVTKNGGLSWVAGPANPSFSSGFTGNTGSIRWTEEQNGQGFGKSIDDGHHYTWYQFPSFMTITPASMDFFDGNHGYLWTLSGRLFITNDGGRHFIQQ